MENVLIVLPEDWDIKKVRYVQKGTRCLCLNVDNIPTPLESNDSLYNDGIRVVKRLGKFDSIDPASLQLPSSHLPSSEHDSEE